jgi:hypothetical protein
MAGVTGRQADIAFAKFAANSWGVAASVTKGVYFQSDGGLTLRPAIIADDAMGQSFLEQTEVGNIEAPTPAFSAISRYEDHTYIWEACAMGSPAAVTLSNSADTQTTSWAHIFDLAPTNDGLGVTVAIDRVRYVEELTSAKIHGWSETNGEGGLMRETFKVIGSKPTITSSININSTVAGASYPALSNRIMMKQGVLRMNLHGGNSLVAGDAVKAERLGSPTGCPARLRPGLRRRAGRQRLPDVPDRSPVSPDDPDVGGIAPQRTRECERVESGPDVLRGVHQLGRPVQEALSVPVSPA